MTSPLPLTALALALTACARPDSASPPVQPVSTAAGPTTTSAPYRFDQPVARFELPDELREISGLTVLDDRHLGAIQDEEGDLYVIDQETGRVSTVVPFGPNGDYEGIALAGDRLFVLRSDGAVLELGGWSGGEARTTTTETGLGAKDCDAEGLTYDAAKDRLLIACKEEGDDAYEDRNVVYAFDLATGALAATPAFVLDPDDVPGKRKLRPSALAIHPVTGQTVLLSSRRESLVALDAAGAVSGVWSLEPADVDQPEGRAIHPNGGLFISSEGTDGPAILARFSYQGP